jgi:hypothetical protein
MLFLPALEQPADYASHQIEAPLEKVVIVIDQIS